MRPLPFRWLLPVGQLLFCAILLWPFRLGILAEVRTSFQYRRAGIPNLLGFPPGSKFVIDLDNPEVQRREREGALRIWGPALLNLPALFVQLPYVIASPTKNEWTPTGMWYLTWRDISWPLIGLMFWWMAGRGMDALLAARHGAIAPRIGWVGTLVGFLLLAMGLIVCIAVVAEHSAEDDPVPWIWVLAAGGIWVLLGGSIVAARMCQRRIGRHLRHAAASASATPV